MEGCKMADRENNNITEADDGLTREQNPMPAEEGLHANEVVSKSDLLAKMVGYASRMDKVTLAQAVELMSKTPDEVYDGNKASTQGAESEMQNKASINSSGAPKEMMHVVGEDLNELIGGADLSENFRDKAKVIFEAAVNSRINLEVAKLDEQYATMLQEANEVFNQKLEEAVEEIHSELVEQDDQYLNYVVAEWVTDNKLAIETGLRADVTESFLTGLKSLFEEHYVDIPAEKTDVVESLALRVEELEAKLNEATDKNITLSKSLDEVNVKVVSEELSIGLTETQKDKFKNLLEAIDFTNADEYKRKASILKETYFSAKSEAKVETDQLLTEEVEEATPAKKSISSDPQVSAYAAALSKFQRK